MLTPRWCHCPIVGDGVVGVSLQPDGDEEFVKGRGSLTDLLLGNTQSDDFGLVELDSDGSLSSHYQDSWDTLLTVEADSSPASY